MRKNNNRLRQWKINGGFQDVWATKFLWAGSCSWFWWENEYGEVLSLYIDWRDIKTLNSCIQQPLEARWEVEMQGCKT
jgi:hypothetical protein